MLKEEKKKPLFTIYDYLKKTYQYAKYSKKNLLFFLLGNVAYCIINVIAPLLSRNLNTFKIQKSHKPL